MGKSLEEYKKNNIDKIKIGACLELDFISNNFYNNFIYLKNFLLENKELLNFYSSTQLIHYSEDIMSILNNFIDFVLLDIDKTENFCKYHSKYY